MPLPYPVIGNFTGSINSGSILSEQDNSLFFVSQSVDAWFGFSPNDVIEVSTYNVDDDSLMKWGVIGQDKQYKTVTSTYLDSLNVPHDYTYRELIRSFVQYKNDKILIDQISDLNNIGVTDGSFKASYNFIRNLAGHPNQPLSIKEISPSRTEIKLVPQRNSDVSYASFCLKKFPNRDVAPVLLSITQKCPYDSIYRIMYPSYQADVEFLKTIFFLRDDGSVLTFLRNLYEDLIKYTLLTEDQITAGNEPTRISRTQGIRTYFSNYLLQNYDSISDFSALEQKFSEFVNLRLNQQFGQYSNQQGADYKGARKFVYDFFFTYFYANAVHPLQRAHQQKYFGYLKNVLNFGNNRYFQILTHDFIDERQSPNDPLTLVVKLSTDLPTDISQKGLCWVSNFGMTPFIMTAILRNPVKYKTLRISAPNFGSTTAFVSKENVNKLYSTDDLTLSDETTNNIFVNKSISTLNTDFTDFSNFVVFSSAAARLNIFKNKMKTWTALSSSLSTLNDRYIAAISASSTYPYYSQENTNLNTQITDLVQSFDSYEAYLFGNGNYAYSLTSGSFINSTYVDTQDVSASLYDQTNRDYLVSNTPEYILNDTNNEEYLTFLSMVGHHFDNIYTYISALPIERQVQNELSSSIPTNTLKEMLYSFGWNVDDIIGNLDLNDVYLNSLNASSYNVMSGEQRLQTIWNRILITLPGIYKTKGTEECVRYLMSCYGLPSSLISIREYGGTDYATGSQPTYKLDEKTYMATFSGVNDYIEGPYPASTQTVEFKFSVDTEVTWSNYQHINLFTTVPYPYTNSVDNAAWSLGIHKVPGQSLGKVIFQMGSGSTGVAITSDQLPIFNGDIFSVMLRRYEVNSEFETTSSVNDYPTQYELVVQRNENGRQLFRSSGSVYLQSLDNMVFGQYGTFYLSDGMFRGTLDKLSIWDVPIGDNDFEEHVNDLNSYGYSGSIAYKNLWVRLSLDYPKSLYYNLSGSSAVWMDNMSSYYAIPNYYSDPLNLSSSIDATLWSASVEIIDGRWLTYHPTGSVEIIARNFPIIVGQNWSASYNATNCQWTSASVYPYHYEELTYQQDIDASKYGPNKYKNKKIRKLDYTIETRFDSDDRSTSQNETVSGESNQLGFFIDPQDSKNKDIIRYVGKAGIMELIGDPANLYADHYSDLKSKNVEYNASGNKKTYFNEMLTIFKFYFDKSIFQVIKNILPARANSFTGVVIEPTILERPKYQNRQITSSVEVSYQNPGIVNNIYIFSENLLWANFNDDWRGMTSQSQAIMTSSLPPSYTDTIDLSYINEPLKIRPANLFCGYVTDYMDDIQHGMYGDYERLTRGWEPEVNCRSRIWGSVSRQKQNDLASISEHHVPNGIDETGIASGSKHQILYYMLKTWEKFEYNAKSGEYIRSNNPGADPFSSASVYLYKYIMVDERFMNQYVHFYNEITTSIVPNDPSQLTAVVGANTYYKHQANTFKNTPDQVFSNTSASFTTADPITFPTLYVVVNKPATQYFELVKGFPRNHFSHKAKQFSKDKHAQYINHLYNIIYVKSRQTIDTTINTGGISDGTFPVESFNVSNVNVKNSSNVIQYIPSNKAGSVIPVGLGGGAGTVSSTSTGGGSGISPTPTVPGIVTPPSPGSGAGGVGGGGCLLAGTQIMLEDGSTRNVERIAVGDVLKSANGLNVIVMELKPNRFHEHYVLNDRLKITYEHPVVIFENDNYRLVNTKHLKVGDSLLKYDGTTERLDTIVIVSEETPTFNFVVSGNHLYVAEGIVVHNVIQKN
jgi:hypothetical protein